MYKHFIRPILFCFSPEFIHHIIVLKLKIVERIPGLLLGIRKIFVSRNSSSVHVFGLKFPNRIGIAAGFDKNAELVNILPAFGFGHIEIGTLTPMPQHGNPKPRLFRLIQDKALVNRMGFNNVGIDKAIENLKKRKKNPVIIGGNIGKNSLTDNEKAYEDYLYCFEKLYDFVDYFVINVSCPNINNLAHLQNKNELDNILSKIMNKRLSYTVQKPVLLKISPDLNYKQIDDTLEVVIKNNIDGLVISNTTIERKNLKTSPDRIKQIGHGGLSGLPLKDKSTELIRYVSKKVQIPIIGVGGIFTPSDAIEKLKAGATLVQVYTGFIYEGPFIAKRLNKAIDKFFNTISEKT